MADNNEIRNGLANLELVGNEENQNRNAGRHEPLLDPQDFNVPDDDLDEEMREMEEILQNPPGPPFVIPNLNQQRRERVGPGNINFPLGEGNGRWLLRAGEVVAGGVRGNPNIDNGQGAAGAARPQQNQVQHVAAGALRPLQNVENAARAGQGAAGAVRHPQDDGNAARQGRLQRQGRNAGAGGRQRQDEGYVDDRRQDNGAGNRGGQVEGNQGNQVGNDTNRGRRGVRAGINQRRYHRRLNPYQQDLQNAADFFINMVHSSVNRTRTNLQRERNEREREQALEENED